MSVNILTGDCREVLAGMGPESVHMVCTSPPYWGLRDYGLEPLIWGGREDCEHSWSDEIVENATNHTDKRRWQHTRNGRDEEQPAEKRVAWLRTDVAQGQFCRDCGAWRGSLGLEPTPELFVEHIVEVFREVKRVLRKDGTCWVNMGDCYASSPNGWSAQRYKDEGTDDRTFRDKAFGTAGGSLKAKDLCMMPARVALALQSDGWWLRSMMPWVKRNSMPESVTDRPASAIEYVFLLGKSPRYFFDIEAVRQARISSTSGGGGRIDGDPMDGRHSDWEKTYEAQSRNPRNTDLFYESLANPYGLISSADGEPLALDVNPAPYPEAHFATFPPSLVVPLIRAGTSEKGCCPECGAPWRREVERGDARGRTDRDGDGYVLPKAAAAAGDKRNKSRSEGWSPNFSKPAKTTGWRPSCECDQHWGAVNAPALPKVNPCTVLDPFGGAGTVGLVADRLGRNAILIEAKPEYADMARKRIADDAGMFAEVAVG